MERRWTRVGGIGWYKLQFTRGPRMDYVTYQFKSYVKISKHKIHILDDYCVPDTLLSVSHLLILTITQWSQGDDYILIR